MIDRPARATTLASDSRRKSCRASSRVSAKSFVEPRVVEYRGEVVVRACFLAEPRQQLDGASEVVEGLVAGIAREGRKARVVVVKAGMVGCVLKARADRFERIGVALFAVGTHRIVVERPRLTPVDVVEARDLRLRVDAHWDSFSRFQQTRLRRLPRIIAEDFPGGVFNRPVLLTAVPDLPPVPLQDLLAAR